MRQVRAAGAQGTVELAEIGLPDFGLPDVEPSVPAATYQARLASAADAAADAGLDALLVYADREHFANLSYLTRFDPRFEEALLILVPGRAPALLVGNEGVSYAAVVPAGIDVIRYQSFSLVNQPRSESKLLSEILAGAGLGARAARRVGIAGWKYFGPAEGQRAASWIEAPAYLVEELRVLGCEPVNASAIFVQPGHGLRLVNDVDQIACFEFAATHGSESMRRLLLGVQPGLTEHEAFALFRPIGLPFSYHPMVLSGERTSLGLASSSGRVLRRGDPMSAGFGYWGSNIARGGFLASSAADLPAAAADYVDRLVAPYFACACEWYETIGIGVTGGEPSASPSGTWATRSSVSTSTPATSSTWMSGQAPRSSPALRWPCSPGWRYSSTSSRRPARLTIRRTSRTASRSPTRPCAPNSPPATPTYGSGSAAAAHSWPTSSGSSSSRRYCPFPTSPDTWPLTGCRRTWPCAGRATDEQWRYRLPHVNARSCAHASTRPRSQARSRRGLQSAAMISSLQRGHTADSSRSSIGTFPQACGGSCQLGP